MSGGGGLVRWCVRGYGRRWYYVVSTRRGVRLFPDCNRGEGKRRGDWGT